MKKGIVVTVALCAAAAWGVNIYPWQAKSDNTAENPSLAIEEEQLKSLWGAADGLSSAEETDISTNNGEYYDDYESNYDWKWIMVRLKYTEKEHNFTGRWEAYTGSYENYPMEVYVWDPVNTEFDWKDTGPESIFTTPRTFTIQPMYWAYDDDVEEYVCLILVRGRTVPNHRDMHVDVVNASY